MTLRCVVNKVKGRSRTIFDCIHYIYIYRCTRICIYFYLVDTATELTLYCKYATITATIMTKTITTITMTMVFEKHPLVGWTHLALYPYYRRTDWGTIHFVKTRTHMRAPMLNSFELYYPSWLALPVDALFSDSSSPNVKYLFTANENMRIIKISTSFSGYFYLNAFVGQIGLDMKM